MIETLRIKTSDKRTLTASHFSTQKSDQWVLLNSALGVRREFYRSFAEFLTNHGYNVLTWDYRSIGDSNTEPVQTDNARMSDWGTKDLEAILCYLNRDLAVPWEKLTLLGHSAGGQLCGLAPSIRHIKRMTFISSGTAPLRLYSFWIRLRLLLTWTVSVPLITRLYGYAPGKFGIGHDLPTGVIQEWKNWCLMRDYLFSDPSLDKTGYKSFQGNIRAVGFSDDLSYTPPETSRHLLAQFPHARTHYRIFTPKELFETELGHFSFFKKPSAWPPVLKELELLDH